ncbi:sensor histidine kinase [Halobaculum sp. EA56]|uniref:sensor histidine kinase n=1 Tax=Halobaculum sp. EA56 TaxID=3421648 RepID=UPI003EC14EB6
MTFESTPSTTEGYFADLYRLASSDELGLEERIERAIEIGRDRLGASNGVLSYTADGKYEVVASTIDSGTYAPGGVSALEDTWCRHVTERRKLVGFADVVGSTYADDVARETTGLTCYIGAPVVVDNETYGTLCFSSEDPRTTEFTEPERQFVELLAQWVSYELERDRHHRELRVQNERLDEFVGIVAHDLRNPLSTITGYTELAIEAAEGEQAEFLARVKSAADRMDRLIGDLLRLARDGGDVGEREPVDIAAIAQQAWSFFADSDASLIVRTEKTIYANRSRLEQLFENAFRNVVEHCPPGTTVVVRDTDDGFMIEDDGPGMPEALAASLFSSEIDREVALGLGLLIIERVVNGHGWDGEVDSDDGGTTLVFRGVEDAEHSGAGQIGEPT